MRAGLGLVVLILLGCGGKTAESTTPSTGSAAPAKASPEVEADIGKMTEYQTRMCACADKACVEQVAGEMGAWSEKQAKKYAGNEPIPSDEQKDRITKISEQLGACMTQVSAPPAE